MVAARTAIPRADEVSRKAKPGDDVDGPSDDRLRMTFVTTMNARPMVTSRPEAHRHSAYGSTSAEGHRVEAEGRRTARASRQREHQGGAEDDEHDRQRMRAPPQGRRGEQDAQGEGGERHVTSGRTSTSTTAATTIDSDQQPVAPDPRGRIRDGRLLPQGSQRRGITGSA